MSIEDKLNKRHKNFLKYCADAGKNFVHELSDEDFIAYRVEYSVSHEEIADLKEILYVKSEESLEHESFDFEEFEPHKDIIIRDFKPNFRIGKFLTKKTISENTAISYLPQKFSRLKNSVKTSKKKSTTNIADKKIFSTDSFQKIFNVESLETYEKILVINLNFSKRVMNCFQNAGIENIAQLLKYSPQKLGNIKNLGCNSIEEIISILKNFFNDNLSANSPLEKTNDIQPSPYINLIISALEKFIIVIKFRHLPAQISAKKIIPFIDAYNFNHNHQIRNISPDITVSEFAEYLTNINNFNSGIFRDFADWLNFDLNTIVEKLFKAIFKNERELNVIFGRADNKTLDEIGKDFGLTRERVRQIEAKTIKKFEKIYWAYSHNIFLCVYAMSGGKKIINFDDFKNFVSNEYAKILRYFATKLNFDEKIFYYDEELNAVIFQAGVNLTEIDISEFKNYLPNKIVEENIFLDAVENYAREKSYPADLLKAKLESIYCHTGKFFHSIKITGNFKCMYILQECFPNGYKIDDETHYNRFIRCLKEFFGEEENLTQRAVDAKIGILGVLCGRGKYTHPDLVHVPRPIINIIKNFIENSERNVLPFKEIFKALEDKFIGTQINNHYILQGIIKLYKMPYELRKDYLIKSGGINIAEEFNAFVKEHGEVTTQEIKQEFISFDDHNIAFILPRCPEVIPIGNGFYIHSTRLNLNDRDFVEIEKFLRQICTNNPVNSRQVLDLFYEKFFDFLSRNKIDDNEKLFGVLKYMFQGKLHFSRPYISVEEIKNVTNRQVLLGYLEGMDAIDIEDLINICNENEIGYVSTSILIESLRPNFIRIDEFTLHNPESIGVTEEIISAVCAEVKKSMARNGGWIAAKNFDDYEWIPRLEVDWTDFLLESIVALAEEKIHVLKLQLTRANFSNAVFVSENFANYDFKSFLIKILRDEDKRQPFQSQAEILDWLQNKGLCVKKLPRFLFAEGYLDANGKIALQ
ncbi:MAG: hypothetical protein IKZ58_03500 [Selenomonadaceae bacterium]|nr:hypothetical protein [Selenomonadaceae bacterium]